MIERRMNLAGCLVTSHFRDDGSNFAGLWLGGKMNGLFVCDEVIVAIK
jgi:hypothetical protein